jgi:hypothetical protein
VGDITVSAASTSINFTGLNILPDDNYLLVSDVYNSSGTGVSLGLFINGTNTLTNYYSQRMLVNNTNAINIKQKVLATSTTDAQ